MASRTLRLNAALRDDYQALFDSCVIRASKIADVERIVDRLTSNTARYEAVGAPLGVPWYVVAVLHNMESSQNFDCHLHNGDPLDARTVHWPSGYPKDGQPPFTWEYSARDALTLKRLHKWTDWTVAGTLFQIERFNGFGYRLYHPEVKSPYLWSGSEHYSAGKYVRDGVWSPTARSAQIGAVVVLRRMAERGIVSIDSHGLAPAVERLLRREQPLLHYSRRGPVPYAAELQTFLSSLPGIYLKPDGWPGERTSNAFYTATGYYLDGDPRAGTDDDG